MSKSSPLRNDQRFVFNFPIQRVFSFNANGLSKPGNYLRPLIFLITLKKKQTRTHTETKIVDRNKLFNIINIG